MKKLFAAIFIIVSLSHSQYSLNTERIGGARHFGEENIFRVSLIYNGKTIKTIEQKLPYDVPFPASYINETIGAFVLSYPFDGFVEVYDGKGEKIWKQDFFKEMSPNYERTISVALGSSTLAFLTSDVELQRAVVHRYTIDGVQQWETLLPHTTGYEIALSPNEQTIIAGSYLVSVDKVHQSATLINAKGTINGNIDILFRKAAFSDDGKFTALSSDREVVVISNETSKELYRTTKQTKGIITDLIWKEKNLIVQESEIRSTLEHSFVYADPLFINYSFELKKISEQQFVDENFKTAQLKNKNGKIDFIQNGKTTTLFQQ